MTPDDLKNRILGFARHCGDAAHAPESAARLRGWLDAHGLPTADGRALIEALHEQEATRTVFRGATV